VRDIVAGDQQGSWRSEERGLEAADGALGAAADELSNAAGAYCRPNCVAFSTRSDLSSERIASASWSARLFSTGRARVRILPHRLRVRKCIRLAGGIGIEPLMRHPRW
jgi:hypothetical protein